MGPATGWWWQKCRWLQEVLWRFDRDFHQCSRKHTCTWHNDESKSSCLYRVRFFMPMNLNHPCTHLHSQSLMPLSKCLQKTQSFMNTFTHFTVLQSEPRNYTVVSHCWCKSHVRLSEDVKHGDTLGRLRRVQVIQHCHGVDDAEHYSRFHPVIHQVGISQSSCESHKNKSESFLIRIYPTVFSGIYLKSCLWENLQ